MVKLTNFEAYNLATSIDHVMNGFDFSFKTWRILSKNAKSLKSIKEDYDTDRVKLAETHAKKDDDGNPIIEDGRYIMTDKDAFDKEFEDFQNEEVEIDLIMIEDVEALDDLTVPKEYSVVFKKVYEHLIKD